MFLSKISKAIVIGGFFLAINANAAEMTGEEKKAWDSFSAQFPANASVDSVKSMPIKGWYEINMKASEESAGKTFLFNPDNGTLFFGVVKVNDSGIEIPAEDMEASIIEGVYQVKIPELEVPLLYAKEAKSWLIGEFWKGGDMVLSGIPAPKHDADGIEEE